MTTPLDPALQQFVDQMADGVALADRDGRVVAWNPAAARLSGTPASAALGGDLAALAGLPAALDLAAGPWRGRVALPRGALDATAQAWVSAGGPAGTMLTLRELPPAAQALHETERKLAALLELLPVGVAISDASGAFAYINQAMRQIAHLDLSQLPGTQSDGRRYIRLDGTPRPVDELATARARAEQRLVAEVETGIELPSGERIWLSVSAMPVELGGWRVVSLFTDIGARVEAERALQAQAAELSRANAELERALQLKDEFLAMMSHELRTPLNAILGFADMLGDSVYGPLTGAQQEVLSRVTDAGRHLLGLLSDILDMTRLEAGGVTLDAALVDVDALCRRAMQLVQGRAAQKQLRLSRTVSFGVERLRADERRLTQILANLLDNAVKFTPDGGAVELSVAVDPGQSHIAFTVADTGIGIAEGDMGRLFKPFTQIDGRLSRQYGGIGLGLSLVRRLADLHQGSVSVESAPGQGSRFTVRLPWSPSDNIPPRAAAAAALAPRWRTPPRVLVVDDDELTVAMFAEILALQGCQVTTARSGAEALRVIQERPPDVVLLDIQMSGMDGLAVIRRVRADPPTAALPILAVTALAMPGDRERCLAAGATRYLAKPVGARELLAQIAEALGGRPDAPPA